MLPIPEAGIKQVAFNPETEEKGTKDWTRLVLQSISQIFTHHTRVSRW